MKTTVLVLFAVLGLVGCSSVATRHTDAPPGQPPVLPGRVNLPPSMMSIVREDNISEAFGYRVASAPHEQGIHGRIHYIEPGDAPVPNVPLVDGMLHEWRVDPI